MHTPSNNSDCHPLSLTREIADFPIANIPLREHQRIIFAGTSLTSDPCAWLSAQDVAAFLASDKTTLCDESATPLAWHGESPAPASFFTAQSSFLIRYPWDLLRANELYISALCHSLIDGEVHPLAVVEGMLQIGSGSRVLPGVFIEGNVVIGTNCKIGPNCYVRGNTSIGDGCHIGQSVEIKNCLILANTNVGHLSYVGDSILGEKVNLGAGTNTSNLRHDGKNHRSLVNGVLLDTGRRKLGAIFGDGVHTGINTSIYPGRKLWPATTTLPGEIVQQDIQS